MGDLRATEKKMMVILALVVISWGLNIVMVKYLTQFMHPIMVAAIRMPLAGVVLLPFVWKSYGLYIPTARQWLLLFWIALSSIFIHQMTLAYGVTTTSATNTSLILGLNPLTTALLAALFVGEKLTGRLLVGVCLGFIGVAWVVTVGSIGSPLSLSGWGDIIILLSMLSYVIGGLLIKKALESMPTLVITAYSTIIGALMLNVAALGKLGAGAYAEIPAHGLMWAAMLLSAWGASTLGTLGWNKGIKVLGASRTALFINGMPFASMVGAVVFLGEELHWIHAVAFFLTTAGILMGTRRRSEVFPPSSVKGRAFPVK